MGGAFENWECEFLQMAVFVLLTTCLVQKGSPESRRPGAKELVDTDPRDFAHDPEAPWPVRRGGWILLLYEHSLGLAFIVLFLLSWIGHASADSRSMPRTRSCTTSRSLCSPITYLVALLVRVVSELAERVPRHRGDGLARRLPRQRWSPESKPVHAPHAETGR